jgi:hypothetical protein
MAVNAINRDPIKKSNYFKNGIIIFFILWGRHHE